MFYLACGAKPVGVWKGIAVLLFWKTRLYIPNVFFVLIVGGNAFEAWR